MKSTLDGFMRVQSKDKIKTDKFTVSYRNTTAVNVTDASFIPAEYLTPQEPKIDKKGIAATIKSGQTVPGAELEQRKSLSIR